MSKVVESWGLMAASAPATAEVAELAEVAEVAAAAEEFLIHYTIMLFTIIFFL
jgi:hypothetical protein